MPDHLEAAEVGVSYAGQTISLVVLSDMNIFTHAEKNALDRYIENKHQQSDLDHLKSAATKIRNELRKY